MAYSGIRRYSHVAVISNEGLIVAAYVSAFNMQHTQDKLSIGPPETMLTRLPENVLVDYGY